LRSSRRSGIGNREPGIANRSRRRCPRAESRARGVSAGGSGLRNTYRTNDAPSHRPESVHHRTIGWLLPAGEALSSLWAERMRAPEPRQSTAPLRGDRLHEFARIGFRSPGISRANGSWHPRPARNS
jgi:hypothetical protein